jgi:hypothetical protein
MTTFLDIQPGESWACRYTLTQLVDDEGNPITNISLAPGEAHPGQLQTRTGIGIIQIRDVEQRRVQLVDVETHETLQLSWDACTDIEPIEWQE